ncbi:MAG: arginine repressor [Oscillospiraceae bacterium]|nr:arginine repressor [Oscillospiraceae bacterium]MBR4928063.1 arginine repressor [Oscillospiraceae bacterium]MBR5045391.1 arginine repressor [Oscillospiraceae bacterium]MBR5071032.1 arginine repressor [Oscillospiraceae bacterium]MBR5979486.1 arginine repressor [Oscillospiraceae bacterium]
MGKKERLSAIKKIVTEKNVSTQEEMISLLREAGFDVTQATASRDINELGLIKTVDASGRSHYSFPESGPTQASVRRYKTILRESIVSADTAQNLVVIKCHTGMGNAACESLDNIVGSEVVGTIAGDNTIFVACRDVDAAAKTLEMIIGIIEG